MTYCFTGYRTVSRLFWILALTAVAIWSVMPSYVVGWDLRVYETAVRSLMAGHDPYADGNSLQHLFHSQPTLHPDHSQPYTYVYGPITLPLLRIVTIFPLGTVANLYWLAYGACVLIVIWVGMQWVKQDERKLFSLLAPASVFFPGLVHIDTLFSGNVAIVFYGLIFAATRWGWRTGNWQCFYIATITASCCKAPWLIFLLIPILSARKQWLSTCITGVVGIILFAIQHFLWPSEFNNYLEAINLRLAFNHDFGLSPAGQLADALYYVIPYQITSATFYAFYASLIFATLLYLSRKFLCGYISWAQWAPVLFVGVALLLPRIMEYDVAPIAIPMALIAWRFLGRSNRPTQRILGMSVLFAAVNGIVAISGLSYNVWKHTECVVLVGIFAIGSWDLFMQCRDVNLESSSVSHEAVWARGEEAPQPSPV
jgi:hypothetical protein